MVLLDQYVIFLAAQEITQAVLTSCLTSSHFLSLYHQLLSRLVILKRLHSPLPKQTQCKEDFFNDLKLLVPVNSVPDTNPPQKRSRSISSVTDIATQNVSTPPMPDESFTSFAQNLQTMVDSVVEDVLDDLRHLIDLPLRIHRRDSTKKRCRYHRGRFYYA